MCYKNTKTGVVIDSPCAISGEDWVPIRGDLKAEPVALEKMAESKEDIQLSKMKVKELKNLAAELEIDLGNATRKDDIIAVILAENEG